MSKHRKLKIVLMSATINHEIFIKYFNNAPLLTIPGFTYPVKDMYVSGRVIVAALFTHKYFPDTLNLSYP